MPLLSQSSPSMALNQDLRWILLLGGNPCPRRALPLLMSCPCLARPDRN
uniref:Uncharacterized protein n=1 Tax=Picea glauca TaxID=3330 RepID=A0A101LUH9_PICGL|nr:hypothetical protein ABT39_MTgene2643 [Picea glauca]